MPTFSSLRFVSRLLLPILLCLPAGQGLYAQVTPAEGHLTSPQTPARAKSKITIYPGFFVPAGGSFEGELVPNAVNPPEATTLTVSANVTIRAGESTPLTASVPPLVGNAISFDGLNDYVTVGDRPNLKMNAALTMEAWVYPTGTGSDATAGGIILNKEGEYQMARFADGTLRWAFANTTPGWQWVNTGVVLPLNTWSHVAVTYQHNSTNQSAVIKTFLNGTARHSHTGSGAIGDAVTGQNEFRIGGRQALSQYFKGMIDEVRVWNAALADAALPARYQRTIAPGSAEAAGLAGYWRLDDALDNHLAGDLGPSAYAGVLFNLPRRVRSTVPFTTIAPPVIQWVQSDAQCNALPGAPVITGPRLEVSPTQTSYYRASTTHPDGREECAVVMVTVQPALGPLPQVRDNLNHIVEHTVLKKSQSESSLSGLTAAELAEKITYFDGLGRPIQQVSTQASPGRKDLVQPIAYDAFGREDKKYLPYPHLDAGDGRYKHNALTEQKNRYDALKNEGPASAETRFEASPLNRPLEQGAPGDDWQLTDPNARFGNQNHSVKTARRTNRENEVREWVYDFDTDQATGNGFYTVAAVVRDGVTYQEGELQVTEVMDEQNHVSLEYKDQEGRVVCKKVQDKADVKNTSEDETTFASTYYVYDSFGRLRFVIPPQAVEELEAGTSFSVGFESNFAKRWLFAYRYDDKGRLSEKRVPGAQPVYLVYNGRDELVLTQDGRQRTGYNSITAEGQLETHQAGEWSFTKYDALGRVVMSGLFRAGAPADAPLTTRAAMQQRVDDYERDNDQNPATNNPLFEKRESGAGSLEGYSQQAYPRLGDGTLTPLSVSYYDDYSFPNASSLSYAPLTGFAQGHIGDAKPAQLKGKTTGSKTRLLGSLEWLHSVVYYDEYNRTIQTITENHSRSGSQRGRDIVWNNYDFAGKLLNSQTRHEHLEAVGAKTRTVKTRTTYDHASRVTGSYQQVEEGTEERLAELSYNELGELDSKKLGKEGLQQVDYGYNIRGWLTRINDASLTQSAGQPKDLFGLELEYNSLTAGFYNGNISKKSWMSHSDQVSRSYAYGYDPMNRLLSADYAASLTGQSPQGATEGAFSLSNLSYDKNGNIMSLTRKGLQSIDAATRKKTFGLVDQLSYQYELNGTGKSNQLLSVGDGQLDKTYLAGDFKDGVSQAVEYEYDGAGNLQKDLNKGITEVLYNHLNLPVQVKFGADRFIRYFYDASGVKRRKVSQDGTGATVKVTDYLSGMVYEQNLLQFIPTAEGRALPPEQTGEHFFAYEYHYKDQLGNLRAAFRKAPAMPAFVATMEPALAPREEAQFDNIARTRSSEHALNSTLNAAGHSARVGPMPDGTRQVLGPWRTVAVKQGDRLQAQVYAYYTNSSPNNESQRVRLTGFVNPQTAPPTGEQTANLWDKLKLGLSFDLARPVAQDDNSVPVAYLKYIVYDKDYKPLKDDYIAITSAALAANGGWEKRFFDFTATEEGYVQVLVANESEKPVWFDDLEVKHTPALIVQENHYDPWGLNLAGIEKQGAPDHKFQYIGREKQEELGLNWLDLKARMYDPQLGRFHAVDPKPDVANQESLSTYQYGYNNPVLKSDPNGDCPICPFIIAGLKDAAQEYGTQVVANLAQGKSLGNALTDVDGYEIAKAGVIGAVTLGAGNIAKSVRTVSRITDAANDGKKAADKIENVAKLTDKATPSPNVQKVLDKLDEIKKDGGTIKANKLDPAQKQEVNLSISQKDGTKMDVRVETHPLSPKVGGDGVTPQRHLNADVYNESGNKLKMKEINGGHKVLE